MEDINKNVYRLKASVDRLQEIFSHLQDNKSLDSDVLMQYGRDLHQLKLVVDAEQKKTVEEKLQSTNEIPREFFPSSDSIRHRKPSENVLNRTKVTDEETEFISNAMLKARSQAIYKADVRKQLLNSRNSANSNDEASETKYISDQEKKQEELAEVLLEHSSRMKQIVSTAGKVIREDNATIDVMRNTAEDNRTNLERESKRLEYHAYKSCFDCFVLFIIVLVIWSFIGMVLIMKVFPKKNYS
uniref:Vesicle transport protein USE1 n=1 Tax=Acrobeloides nanus TaxID=290746 RepID=A0A914DHG0_9BILA